MFSPGKRGRTAAFSATAEEGYAAMLEHDSPLMESSLLYFQLSGNPKLLASEVSSNPYSASVVAMLLAQGSLRCADSIIIRDNVLLPGADPFYCGEVAVGSKSLFYSAGVIFYLSLLCHRFNAQNRSGLSSVLQEDMDVVDLPTYVDHFYYVKDGVRGSGIMESARVDMSIYRAQTVTWFMQKALEVFMLESQLSSDFSSERSAEIYALLGRHYLIIANMEDYRANAGVYFLDKAIACFMQAPSYAQVVEHLKVQKSIRIETVPGRLRGAAELQDCYDVAEARCDEFIRSNADLSYSNIAATALPKEVCGGSPAGLTYRGTAFGGSPESATGSPPPKAQDVRSSGEFMAGTKLKWG